MNAWNDPDVNEALPIPADMELILSEKDKVQHSFKEYAEKYGC